MIIPFHVHEYVEGTNSKAGKHVFTPTYEHAWVAKRSFTKADPSDKVSGVNILSTMDAFPKSNQREVATWMVEWHDVGLIRLVCPVLIWRRDTELKAKELLRLGL